MSDWHDVTVVARHPSAANLTALDLETQGTPVAASHERPGQFVKLALEALGESFFAIASAPKARGTVLEFLVKGGAPLADALAALPVGATVRSTTAQGRGFPLEEAQGRDALLFATGSGISPVRSLIGAIVRARGSFGHVTLYFGVRTPDAFAYAAELEAWTRAKIEIVRTVSRPGDTGWDGLSGYVQAHIPAKPLADATAFLCGQKAMVQGVTDALVRQGLPKQRIFLNY